MEQSGFEVTEVIHTRKNPHLPLQHPFVIIYVARKRPNASP
jgi:hypothetical protein